MAGNSVSVLMEKKKKKHKINKNKNPRVYDFGPFELKAFLAIFQLWRRCLTKVFPWPLFSVHCQKASGECLQWQFQLFWIAFLLLLGYPHLSFSIRFFRLFPKTLMYCYEKSHFVNCNIILGCEKKNAGKYILTMGGN